MIDVLLYRIDSAGTIDLIERTFPTLGRLAKFFASDAADLWDWAEVTVPYRGQTQRYSADELRGMADPA